MTTRAEPMLVLWDIDQTLIDVGGLGRQMYEAAFLAVTGEPLRELADMAGRTERAILVDTLGLHGRTAEDAVLAAFYQALAKAAHELRHRMTYTGRCLPGASAAVDGLAVAGVVQSVVTGNLRPVAVTKLRAFQLANKIDLEIGGYGDDGTRRASLIRCAWRRAASKYGHDFRADQLVVIGDTPHDIRAAREVGVRSVGVATGASSVEDLAGAKADAVLADLTDTTTVRAVVFGHSPGA